MRAPSMTVRADTDLCQGHQNCQAEAPSIFGFDDDADTVVLLDEHPEEPLRDAVRNAVRYCPAMALSLEEA